MKYPEKLKYRFKVWLGVVSTLVFLTIGCNAGAQYLEHGLPRFINFAPKEYKQESQNFSVTQDQLGIMYFGNLNNILRFDNASWQSYPLKGTPILCVTPKGDIYAGGYNSIVRLQSHFNRVEIKELAIPENIFFGQINLITALGSQVYFIGQDMILTNKNDSLQVIYKSQEPIKAFEAQGKIYISTPRIGLQVFDPGSKRIKPVNNNEYFIGNRVIDVLKFNDTTILVKCLETDGFYFLSPGKISYFVTDADSYINENGYVKSIMLSDRSIVTGTEYGGIICYDDHGQYKFSLNKKHGMLDNRVTDLYVGRSGQLWITTYNGITMVDYPSALGYFNTSYGINGAISTMFRYRGTLYLGSTQGLYYYNTPYMRNPELSDYNDENSFVRVSDIAAETHDITEINDALFLATSKGIYQLLENDKVKLIFEGDFRKIHLSKIFINYAFAIGKNGISLFEYHGDTLTLTGNIQNLNYDVRTIAEDNNKIVWIGSNNDGLFRLDLGNNSLLKPAITHYDEKNGLPADFTWIDVYKTRDGIIFSTQKGVLEYVNKKFVQHHLFKNIEITGTKNFFPILEQYPRKIWFSSINERESNRVTGYLTYDDKKIVQYHTHELEILKQTNVESIYCDNDSIVWFGGFDGLVKYDYSKTNHGNRKTHCLIRKTDLPDEIENSLFDRTGKQHKFPVLNYSKNHIRFDFTALFYDSYGEIEYTTLLDGFQDDWSEWGKTDFKEYTYLPAGDYTFKVRARNVSGNISETLEFKFSVQSPIYLRWWAFVFYVLIVASIIYLILRLNGLKHSADKLKLEKMVAERTDELIRQKEQTEKLVQRLLPEKTVEEIQKDGTAQSKRYELVTVLFADIQGFTQIAETVEASVLVGYLNKIFSTFDSVIAKYEIDKIKTIGDAYMCAGGMRQKDRSTPIEVVLAALQMQEAIAVINKDFSVDINIRIGIHTGSVIAGVVGAQKIEYDIWGDTVNIASRMESYGVVGAVNLSSATYEFAKDFFECEARGKTAVKYKGDLDMFLAHRIKSDLSEFGTGKTPNKVFSLKLQNMRYADLEEFMLQKIERDLPKNLYYHNVRHTVNVCSRVETIGIDEKVSEEELLLLKTAALFHDAGFIISYDNNEPLGANLASDILPMYRYKPEQIQRIRELILATKMPPKPKNHLEQIICDADLDYLGRPDFIVVSQNLFRELFERHKVNTIEEWNRFQYRFISKHEYFTATARKFRDEGKKMVLEELKKRI